MIKKQFYKNNISNFRIIILYCFIFLFFLAIVWRLVILQIIDHKIYSALASGQHEIFKQLFPKRGSIYIYDDTKAIDLQSNLYPLATNKPVYEIFAQPKYIQDPEKTAQILFNVLEIQDSKEQDLIKYKLSKKNDPYEPIKKNVEQNIIDKIKKLNLKGIGFRRRLVRYYPEKDLASNVLGFVRLSGDSQVLGQYGIEGFFNNLLTGKKGFLRSARDAFGRLISINTKSFQQAEDGADIVLTINKSIQFVACSKLKQALKTYEAEKASLTIMNPQTGEILAMCNFPSFDPNEYYKVEDVSFFNNTNIYGAYEPGSIFKPITIAAALDQKKITPFTTFVDKGFVSYNNAGYVETNPKKVRFTLRNYAKKVYGKRTMTEVLEYSINTGTIFAMQKIGPKMFRKYVEDFGFGQLTGIELDTEVKGNISSLYKKGEIYAATASFGQGITVTPLQMVRAYAVFANGGKLVKPFIVKEIHFSDGTIKKIEPKIIRYPISKRTAELVKAMLISVVDNGHAKLARVKGYYIAGKTGTAQVAEKGKYTDKTIQSFVGFGPADNPKFVMIVRLDNPKKGKTSSVTSARVFGQIAKFLIDYFNIPPER